MKPLLLILITLSLTGCLKGCVKAKFSPDSLPDACLNQPYEAKIHINGGTVVTREDFELANPYGDVSNKTFLLKARQYYSGSKDINGAPVPQYDANELTLSGTPTSLKPIQVNVNIAFYKHMFDFQDLEFQKSYTLTVKECN